MDAKTINILLVSLLALVGIGFFVLRSLRKRSNDTYQDSRGYGEVFSPVHAPVVETAPPVFVPQKTEAELLQERRDELESAESPEECYDVFSSVDAGSPVEVEAYEKAVTLLRAELTTADDIDRCWELVDVMRNFDSEESIKVADEAIEKIFTLTTTTDDALSIIDELARRWNDGIEDETERALKLALTLTTDYDEALAVFEKCDSESDLELLAFMRMLTFVEDVESCQSLWDEYDVDSELGELAILRAGEIIKANKASAT
ncbi:MAG: hypothetical protein KBC16_00585 [Candidatus Pacebacteria bacterium]|nr:hypothetical protein [Candidatus Paceibacterota bacterium]